MNLQNIDWSLYAILDKSFQKDRSIIKLAEDLIEGGAGVIQLRNKISTTQEFYQDALRVKEVTQAHGIPLIINDRVDIALAAEADGVHLGQDDLPFQYARKLIGDEMMLGASVHNLEEFNHALEGNPDYVGVGAIFSSETKSELETRGTDVLKQIREKTDRPLIAIGGLTVENLHPVMAAGADGVAVISDLLNCQDVRNRAKQFVAALKKARQQ